MGKRLINLFLILSFILGGCNQNDGNDKGEYDISGPIIDVDNEGKLILVEDKDQGLIWITLPEGGDNKTYQKGQTVAVWTDGKIRETYPLQANALNVELMTTK
jgi:Protein of unknown function (DUF3221)